MRPFALAFTLISTLLVTPVVAQSRPTSPRELSVALASQAAQEALATCERSGFHVSVTVLDRSGSARAFLRGDGSTPHTPDSARGKAYTALTLGPIFNKNASSELTQLIAANPAAAAIANVPGVLLLAGAVTIKSGDDVVGSIGVGGAPGGDKDEACARAGSEKIAAALR